MKRECQCMSVLQGRRSCAVFAALLSLAVVLGSSPVEASPSAYVTHFFSSDTVSVIDTGTNTVVATVPVGRLPAGVAITPDGAHAYVANVLSNSVSVIDTATNTVVATIGVGSVPAAVAITPDGARAYVSNEVSNDVSVIDTATNTVAATVPVGLQPVAVAITPDGTRAYVSNINSSTVSVIATATNTVVTTVPLTTPAGVAITPDGTRAYVTSVSSNAVSVIATPTNTVVATVGVGSAPGGVAITPDGARAYVTNQTSNDVSVIDTATNTVTATIPVGGASFGVATTPRTLIVFSAFAAKAEINLTALQFEVKTTFALGTGSKGIHPLTEDVKLQVGTFSTTLPAGSFEQHKNGQFSFEGVINGVVLEAKITPLGGSSFQFQAEGQGAILAGTANPVTVGLIIGNDGGSTSVTAEFE